jgi:tetratricopeptide (TPR) repeat protein
VTASYGDARKTDFGGTAATVRPRDILSETDQQRLDSMLCEAHTMTGEGRYDESITQLLQAEQEYLALVHGGGHDPYLADLWVTRGMAQSSRGYGASAVLDLDAGVQAYGASGDDLPLELATALALNASVLEDFGDPDLAVRSADAAIGLFLRHQDDLDKGPQGATHAHHLCVAARVAGDVHAGAGRLDIALRADDIGIKTADRLADSESEPDQQLLVEAMTRRALRLRAAGRPEEARPLFRAAIDADLAAAEAVSERLSRPRPPTLGDALAAVTDKLGRPSAYPSLVALTDGGDRPLVAPSRRCELESATGAARELAALAGPALATEGLGPAGRRIGLEAHYLFAIASRYGARAMRFELGEHGPQWARLLLDLSAAFEADRNPRLAMDMAAWGGGLANSLLPFGAGDPQTRALAADCIERHGRLLAAAGDAERAADAMTAVRELRR